MATVEFVGATRRFEQGAKPAVNAINLAIKDGEFLVLVGPSGCGKSTTLRMLAGLEPCDEGQILIDGVDVSRTRAKDRDVAMVFQSYALYPNMTTRQNMSFALENMKMGKDEIKRRVGEAAAMLQLEELMDRKPAHMSGGQRQRVAMGRAIVRDPKVFCLDEPLSNLDAKLRVSTRAEIAKLQRRLGTTTVYVTHDQTEAMTMGDRVCVLKDGVIQQVDTPTNLYERPANTFVAGFIGSPAITLLDGVPVVDGRAGLGEHLACDLGLPVDIATRCSGTVTVGIRPESWRLVTAETEGALGLKVEMVEDLGSESFAYCEVAGEPTEGVTVRGGHVTVRLGRHERLQPEAVIHAVPVRGELNFFHPESGENLAG